MTDDELANKLLCMLSSEKLEEAELFNYLCWLEETHQSDRVKAAYFLVMASDGTTCWGKTYAEAAKKAFDYDKELYEAWKEFDEIR